jgi:hypothetical protein
LATPGRGTQVGNVLGLFVLFDSELTRYLRADVVAWFIQRALQDLRREAELNLDDRITVWLDGLPANVEPYTDAIARETLADAVLLQAPPADVPTVLVDVDSTQVRLGLRAVHAG